MRKTVFLSFLFVCAMTFMGMGQSPAANVKIGLIETARIIKESKAAQQARSILVEEIKEKQLVYQKKQQEVAQIQQELRETAKGESSPLLKERRELLEKEIKELRRLKIDLEEELNRKNQELSRKILGEIGEIVKAFRKENKYLIILEKKSVISADEALDITDKIIKMYDQSKQ